jgi:CheY-like chemotaxis protein
MLLEDMEVAEEVQMVTNAQDAIQHIRSKMSVSQPNKENPCIMFLDINMPGISGFDMIQKLQEEGPWPIDKLKVYILSSSGNQRDLDRAEDLGVNGYLTKPLTRQKIDQVISEVYA